MTVFEDSKLTIIAEDIIKKRVPRISLADTTRGSGKDGALRVTTQASAAVTRREPRATRRCMDQRSPFIRRAKSTECMVPVPRLGHPGLRAALHPGKSCPSPSQE